MFERKMLEKLERIFETQCTFAKPGSNEQNVIFIDIVQPRLNLRSGYSTGHVSGTLSMVNPTTKFPFGWWQGKLHSCDVDDQKDFVFHGFDANEKITGNIVERTCPFTYFFREQFDPASGAITSIIFPQEEVEE